MRYQNKHIILDEKQIKRIYAVGDIHGEFLTFADDLVNSCKVSNCAVIVCGDIGLGFYSTDKQAEFFTRMQSMLSPKNITVIFFRGNHDDPYWFEYHDDDFAVNYPNIIIAEDFSIVDIPNENYPYKILLWGGGISIDRTTRMLNRSYWKNEAVKPLGPEFDKDLEINCVCTHASPDFCLPCNSDNLSGWYERDHTLEWDLKEERETLSRGAYKLFNHNRTTLSLWVYGHYHDIYYNSPRMNDEIARFYPVQFIGLDMMRYTSYDRDNFNEDRYNIYNRTHKNHLLKIFEF